MIEDIKGDLEERQEREVLMLQVVEAMEKEFQKSIENIKRDWQHMPLFLGMFKLSAHGLKLSEIFAKEERIEKSEIIHMMNWLFMLYISDDKFEYEKGDYKYAKNFF